MQRCGSASSCRHLSHVVLEKDLNAVLEEIIREVEAANPGIVEREVETACPLIERHHHELTVSLSPDPIWLDADAARLEQVVLVVDDNVDAAQSLGELLEASGYDVRTAHTGPTAVAAASDYNADVVLLDIGLPELDGYEVAKLIRQQPTHKNTVLVAMTGYGQESDRQKSQKAGFDHHLVKPADFAKVLEILATATS